MREKVGQPNTQVPRGSQVGVVAVSVSYILKLKKVQILLLYQVVDLLPKGPKVG